MSNSLNTSAAATTTIVANSVVSAEALVQSDVLKDTSAATNVQGNKAVATVLEQLVVEREVWEQTSYRTSNEQLYGLLQRSYGFYKSMEGSSAEASTLRSGFKDYINIKGLDKHFSKSSHTLTKIVKCVFGSDRRRVNAYSTVLRSALSQGIGVLDLAKFIRDNGGVEEIRLAKSPNAMTAKQKAAVGNSTVSYKTLGVVASSALSGLLNDAGKIGTNTVLIGTWQDGGSIVIRAVVESNTVLTAALASYYTSVKDVAKAQAEESKAADVTTQKQEAIQAAVAEATVTG